MNSFFITKNDYQDLSLEEKEEIREEVLNALQDDLYISVRGMYDNDGIRYHQTCTLTFDEVQNYQSNGGEWDYMPAHVYFNNHLPS